MVRVSGYRVLSLLDEIEGDLRSSKESRNRRRGSRNEGGLNQLMVLRHET